MIERPVKNVSNYIWNGIYSNWDQASEAAKVIGTGGGLASDQWLQRITKQLIDYRDELFNHGVGMPSRPSNLPLVCAMIGPNSIIDFGGSSGWCWDYLLNSVTNHNIESYVVIETQEVVNYMAASNLHNNPVQYKTINDSIKKSDILYCNSVLQYFASNAPLINLIERTTPEYILLDDLVANGKDDFYTVQNYINSGIPYRFIGLTKLLCELLDHDYVEQFRCSYASPILGAIKPLEMGNFPQENQNRYSLSILFRKSKAK
jgi:putative methyltransferase (TIGR04325 family)